MAKEPKPSGKWNDAATTEPAEEGVYFVRRIDWPYFGRYSYWDGSKWLSECGSIDGALNATARSTVMYNTFHQSEWCGAK